MNEKHALTSRLQRQLLRSTHIAIVVAFSLATDAAHAVALAQLPSDFATPAILNMQGAPNTPGSTAIPGQVQTTDSEAPATNSIDVGSGSATTPVTSTQLSPVLNQSPINQAPASQPSVNPAASSTSVQTQSPLEAAAQAIATRQQLIQEDTEKAADVKEPLIKLYQQTLLDIKAATEGLKQRSQWNARIAAAPRSLEEAKAKRSQTASRATISDTLDYMSFDEVQKELQALQAKLTTATEIRAKLSEQVVVREKRRKELPQLLSDARARVEAVTATSPVLTPSSEDALTKEAVGWASMAARASASEQLQALEAEQRAYEAEAELLLLQLELAQANEKQYQEPVRKVTEELNRMRQDRILQTRDEVRALVADLPQDMQTTSDRLLNRISDWLALATKKASIKAEIDSSKSTFDRWKERFTKMQNRVEPQDGQDVVAGFNSWVGLMLRKQRSELPDLNRLRNQVRYYQQEMHAAESMLFDLEDGLLENNLRLEGNRNSQVAAGYSAELRSEQLLLEKFKEVISAIQVDLDSYLNDLYQLADVKEQTQGLTQKYQSFIDEHVLWIRSCDQLERSDWVAIVEAFRWLVGYENWLKLLNDLVLDAGERPLWYVLFAVVWFALVFNQSRLRRALTTVSDLAAKRNCTAFRYTAEASLFTLMASLPVPMLFSFLYIRLVQLNEGDGSFSTAIGTGLLVAMAVFFPLEILRQTSRQGGLGLKHFDWSETGASHLRSNLRWLIDFSMPLTIIVATFATHNNPRWDASLGRATFILLMIVLAAFFARVFFPRTGILARYLIAYPNGWFDRLRYAWYTALLLIPTLLAVLSFVGYYTAGRLAAHLNTSLWIVVGLMLTFFLLRRWLTLSRKKLMLAQAKQRLADAAKRDPSQPIVTPMADESEVNLVVINEQTMRLVSSFIVVSGLVAVFMIWSDVLPAIAMLENFELWSVQGNKPDETIIISLANLLLVVPILALMVIAGRNVPGLLEIALLQHLPITSAVRYAITTLSRYTIVFVGILFLFNTIGLRWASIQWLVAALGVGLGFGLQEIFANFVSGLILLFEQPIRVGDVITLDGTTGAVSKIRMRATTIVNWDRQELIIPNKDLITGKLLNWTLSDTTNRVVIEVRVAYGVDTDVACAMIMKICKEHPNLLVDPAPVVSFDSFGEGALKLTLRVFLASLDVRLQTTHELNTRIHHAFNEAGIELAIPQRELHISSLGPQVGKWFERTLN